MLPVNQILSKAMKRKRAYVIDVETWEMKPNKTCKLCPNPYLRNEVQKVPVAVVDWRALPQCKLQLTSTVYESSEQFVDNSQSKMETSWRVGLSLPASASLMVGGTHSKLAKMAMEKSKQDKYNFIKQDVHCSYYSYRLKAKPPLHLQFAQSLKHLPAQYNENTKAEYRRLLENYGTHFIKKVQLGGQVSSLTSVRICQATLKKYTETEVKDCLDVEVAARIKLIKVSGATSYCNNDLKERQSTDTFHSQFHDRVTEVEGGQVAVSDLLFPSTPEAFHDWTNSLKTTPGVVTYSLEPLHLLVRFSQKKRNGLKKAIEDYILENALYKHCSEKCSGGSKSSSHDSCTCVCNQNSYITSSCCPAEPGLAQLTVKVMQATGLWGDFFSQTDAFVKIFFDNKVAQTSIIYNNNNPVWNSEFTLGMVKLSQRMELKLEVWDEDKHWFKWWNDKLGLCSVSPKRGSHTTICPLNHGTLTYNFIVECAPGLQGPRCHEYLPSPMNPKLAPLYVSQNAVNVTASLLTHIRMGRPVVDPLLFLGQPKWKNTNQTHMFPNDKHARAFPEL
ncbi:perforin-1-like [Arapaima gigas]